MKLLLAIMLVLILVADDGIASEPAPAVVRYDRYLLVNTASLQLSLEQLITMVAPPGFRPALGETLQYLLRDSSLHHIR